MQIIKEECLASPLLLINGNPCVAALHDLRHGGEVQDGRAGQHEAVIQWRQDVFHRLGAQHPAAELLLHKLAAQSGHAAIQSRGLNAAGTRELTCKGH